MGWCLLHKKRVAKFQDACEDFQHSLDGLGREETGECLQHCSFCSSWAWEKPKEKEVEA